jgi:hypothetical protein
VEHSDVRRLLASSARTCAPGTRALLVTGLVASLAASLSAHGVSAEDRAFLEQGGLVAFLYLGAKHMVTGYDHLLFLAGVIFFLYRLRAIATYVTIFAVGHSVTLLGGVLGGIRADPFLIDAIIGLSVVYRGFDNLGGFRRLFGFQPDTRASVLIFGFFHGFGLATKLQDFALPHEGITAKIVAFNVGVEIGQVLALMGILIVMTAWRRTAAFERQAFTANVLLMACGFVLMGYQLTGYFVERA